MTVMSSIGRRGKMNETRKTNVKYIRGNGSQRRRSRKQLRGRDTNMRRGKVRSDKGG